MRLDEKPSVPPIVPILPEDGELNDKGSPKQA